MDAFPPKGVASEYSQMLFMHIPDTFEAQSCFLTGGWGPVMNCNMKVTDRKMNEILKIHLLFGHLILNTFTFLYLKTYIYILKILMLTRSQSIDIYKSLININQSIKAVSKDTGSGHLDPIGCKVKPMWRLLPVYAA